MVAKDRDFMGDVVEMAIVELPSLVRIPSEIVLFSLGVTSDFSEVLRRFFACFSVLFLVTSLPCSSTLADSLNFRFGTRDSFVSDFVIERLGVTLGLPRLVLCFRCSFFCVSESRGIFDVDEERDGVEGVEADRSTEKMDLVFAVEDEDDDDDDDDDDDFGR